MAIAWARFAAGKIRTRRLVACAVLCPRCCNENISAIDAVFLNQSLNNRVSVLTRVELARDVRTYDLLHFSLSFVTHHQASAAFCTRHETFPRSPHLPKPQHLSPVRQTAAVRPESNLQFP